MLPISKNQFARGKLKNNPEIKSNRSCDKIKSIWRMSFLVYSFFLSLPRQITKNSSIRIDAFVSLTLSRKSDFVAKNEPNRWGWQKWDSSGQTMISKKMTREGVSVPPFFHLEKMKNLDLCFRCQENVISQQM